MEAKKKSPTFVPVKSIVSFRTPPRGKYRREPVTTNTTTKVGKEHPINRLIVNSTRATVSRFAKRIDHKQNFWTTTKKRRTKGELTPTIKNNNGS